MIVRWFALLLVALSLGQANGASQSELDLDGMLKSICNNKEANLKTANELHLLTKQLDTFVGCSKFHRRSISELDRLINNDQDHLELCGQTKADQLLEYYSLFVTNEKYSYPKALRKFFVAYGLRLSAVCRSQMIRLLSRDSHSLLTPDDYEQINQLTGDKSAMAELMSDPKDYDDLVVPKYMIKLLKLQGRATRNEKIYIQTAPTNGTVGRLKTICDRRFKPIYEKLMSPLLSLSSIGFNYKETRNNLDREADVNKDIYQWYRIVLMCESLANIEILELASADDEGHQLMKVTTREEAAAQVEQARALADQRYPEYKQLKYEPELEDLERPSIEDLILDSKNGRLVKAINNFAEPTDQLGSKFYGKLLLFVKDRLKTKNIRVVGSLPDIDKSKQLKKFRDAPTQDLLSLIYEYTQQVHSYRGDKMDKIRKNAWKAFVIFVITIAVSLIIIIMVATLFP